MIRPPDHPGPGRAVRIPLALLMLVDAAAVVALAVLLGDALRGYDAADDGAICGALMVAIVACMAGAAAVARRGRWGVALALAALPAVPAILFGAAILLFVATFHHQH